MNIVDCGRLEGVTRGQMRPKSTGIGQMGGFILGKRTGEGERLSDRTTHT